MKNPKNLRVQIFRTDSKQKTERSTPATNVKVLNIMTGNESDQTSPVKTENVNKESSKDETKPISILQLFRYASKLEIFLILIAVICATGSGVLMPSCIFIFAKMSQVLVELPKESVNSSATNTTTQRDTAVIDAVTNYAIQNIIIAVTLVILAYISIMLLNYTSQRQTFRIREMYMKSILHQDISWYDNKMKAGNVATELTEDIIKFEEGVGEKCAICIEQLSVAGFCIIFAFYSGWKLTLVSLASLPITGVVLGVVARISSSLARKEIQAFGESSSIAEEVLSGIKTVFAFDGQNSELERYKKSLDVSYKLNVKMGLVSGCGFGLFWFGIFANYALSQGYGVTLILNERHLPPEEREYDVSVMLTIFWCTVIGAMNIGTASPYVEVFSTSKAAAAKIFSVIERKSAINSLDPGGTKPAGFRGSIEFKDVEFRYSSRPDVQVLKKVSFNIAKGETVALVGNSGCGKSTCIQLIQRFYDPISGEILLDGQNLRDLNVAWLRRNLGIVGQEPVLFDTTIADNIRFGDLNATMEMVIRAAKESNAHDFIMKLPLKYDTLVGEKGAQISGGQKQRIAIARALIRDPAILLLDEATSALDTRSESKVQAALEKLHRGRTTIIVAHRLSTIRGANKIIVLADGNIVERGRHDELMELKGQYYDLVMAQISADAKTQERRVSTKTEIERIDEDPEPIEKETEISENDADSKSSKNTVGTWKIMKLNKPEWKYILVASIASMLVGSSQPLFAIIMGGVLEFLSDPDENTARQKSNLYVIYFVSAGIAIAVATCLQIFLLGLASERLTTRLRSAAFGAMLRQEMAWFDETANGTGALCAKLAIEAASVKSATGQRIGIIMQCITTLLLSVVLSLTYEWRLGLVGMALLPFMFAIIIWHSRVCNKETLDYHKGLEKSTKIAVEAVSCIKTVVGLGREETFRENYVHAMIPSFEQAKKNVHWRGLAFGLFKSIGYFVFSIIIFYGGVLQQNGETEFSKVFIVGQALVAGAASVSQASAFASSLEKGITAAGKIIRLVQRVPKIVDPDKPEENHSTTETSVNFNSVSFEYPTRPGVIALDMINLNIEAGKTVALVGSSGCGKSTVIKLLERFYDPISGTVDINGTKVASMAQSSLRMLLGLVEQEPILFSRTIRENIAYGDNRREATNEEIIAAAKKANIHNFVVSLPLGYETVLGSKTAMLSGGQKQRVAIARALLRNPKVLLLDEATSALDTESEKIVQAALDKARTGITCILIAHRLSTVENADKICVLHQGNVVESGSHEELVRNGGPYYEMLCLQNKTK